jgi:hypothetical protein
MGEYIQSIKAHLYDRAVSPLFGTFVASWAAWNYQFLLVLFSSMEATEKLSYISAALYPTLDAKLTTGALYPLLTTVVFIFGYPLAAKPVYRYVRKQQQALLAIKRAIEDETPLTVQESRKLRQSALAKEREFETQLHERETLIQALKETITHLENEEPASPSPSKSGDLARKEPVQPSFENQDQEIFELQMRILACLGEWPNRSMVRIREHLAKDIDRVTAEYALGELQNNGLAELAGTDAQGDQTFRITQRGREKLIKNRLKKKPEQNNIAVEQIPSPA